MIVFGIHSFCNQSNLSLSAPEALGYPVDIGDGLVGGVAGDSMAFIV